MRWDSGIKRSGAKILSALAVMAIVVSSCAPRQEQSAAGKLRIGASVPPVAFLAREIGGDKLDIGALVKPGQSPHTFEPTPKQVASVSNCRIFFTAGLPFEEQMIPRLKSMNPEMKAVDTLDGLALLKEDDMPDPDVWMDPVADKQVAEIIRRELVAADPANADTYNAGYERLAKKLDALHRDVGAKMKPFRGRIFLTIHPAYGYFAKRYGLVQESIEHEGKDPGSRGLGRIIDMAKAEKLEAIFTQPQISSKEAEAVADATGAALVSIDPHAENCLDTIKMFADELQKTMELK